MDVRRAKELAKAWVEENRGRWPGLEAAHLTGGITAMADGAPFPTHKDVDLHLIFADGSPALRQDLPWADLIEESFGGIAIEAGIKSVADYASPAAVLGNPEIASHLLHDVVLHDPCGLLTELQPTVRREYRRRRWVRARLEHERRGLAGAIAMRPMARAMSAASGEVNILGYTSTFATAALAVASLGPLRMGSGSALRLKEHLAASGRLDLYDALLGVFGLAEASRETAEGFLREATEAFDRALAIRRTPGPFQHKLHRHLRPYFVDSCRALLAAGHHREALFWVLPYHLASADVLLADGPAAEVHRVAARRDRFLAALGLATDDAIDLAYTRAGRVYDEIFDLAERIVAGHPRVID